MHKFQAIFPAIIEPHNGSVEENLMHKYQSSPEHESQYRSEGKEYKKDLIIGIEEGLIEEMIREMIENPSRKMIEIQDLELEQYL